MICADKGQTNNDFFSCNIIEYILVGWEGRNVRTSVDQTSKADADQEANVKLISLCHGTQTSR